MIHRKKRIAHPNDAVVGRRLVVYAIVAGTLVSVVALLLYAGLRRPAPASVPVPPPSQSAAAIVAEQWGGWLTDLNSAVSAADGGKDILVEFASRQDRIAPLETLLQGPAFAAVRQRYVLVRLDVTTSHSDPATVERTADLIDKLNLSDLPCLVSFDSALRPFGIVKDGEAGSIGELMSRLHAMDDAKARRDSDLAAAAKASGLDRGKLLDSAMNDVGPTAALGYPEVMREIVRLDSDGSAGLKERYAARVSDQLVDDAIQHVVYPLVDAGDLRGALEQARQIEHDTATTVSQRQLLQAFQAQLYCSLGQKQKALAMMDGAIALDPSTDAATRVRSERAKIDQ